jgi:predicted alpha-1,2-mannosidase
MRRATTTLLALLSALTCATPAAADLAGYVNPFNGTAEGAKDFGTGGGAGNTFPGAVVPFGMMQLSPDTAPGTKNAGGGYAYGDTKLRGFGVRRLSGAGCPNGGDFTVLPTTRQVTASPVDSQSTSFSASLLPSFAHGSERATPGRYGVTLDPGTPQAIGATLTAARRSGIERFEFPAGSAQTVLLNATGGRTGATAGEVHIDPARRQISAAVTTGGFCYLPGRYRIYLVARFSRPFKAVGTWRKQTLSPGSQDASDSSAGNPAGLLDPGPAQRIPVALNTWTNLFDSEVSGSQSVPTAQTGAYVTFDPAAARTVAVRVGMSFVSIVEARRNLAAEVARKPFAKVATETRAAWNRALGAIAVHGGLLADRRTFYSMLYHALTSPTTFSDADGSYAGMDGAIHRARGHTQYADFSGWDVYRSQMPLLALIAPRVAGDIARSLIADQRESGWLPKWSVANTQTEVMTGDPADAMIAAIHALGARGFDAHAALAAMVKGATTAATTTTAPGYVERSGLAAYQQLGYVPSEQNGNLLEAGIDTWRRAMLAPAPGGADVVWGSSGTTLEYAIGDFAIARLAAVLGDRATCRTFLARSGNWRNVFDAATGYVQPRSASGQFTPDYDPNSNDSLSGAGFAEGDGAQYTWMVPHDPAGLFAALGGTDAARKRLDALFAQLNGGLSSPHAFLGNEPNSNAPWLYDWLGAPSRTQDVVRRAILSLFDASPGGYPGNDDLGQMSAWYVFGALGLYPAIPGTDVLALGSPLFPSATVHLAGGDVTITARGAARAAPYVTGLHLNGTRRTQPWLRLSDVASGGRLAFDLSSTPSDLRGGPPPSYGPSSAAGCAA